MPTGAAKAKITSDKVLEELMQLSARELDKVLEGAAALRLEKRKLTLPKRESDLLRMINRGLDEHKSAQLDQLQQKLRNETITSHERSQLLLLTGELEKLAADRLKALIELAAIRNTSVSKLMSELHLDEMEYA